MWSIQKVKIYSSNSFEDIFYKQEIEVPSKYASTR